jgi:hypothetical protein
MPCGASTAKARRHCRIRPSSSRSGSTFKSEMVTRYIASIPPNDYEALVDRQQREYVRQYRAAEQWPAETLRQTARNAVAAQLEHELGLPSPGA